MSEGKSIKERLVLAAGEMDEGQTISSAGSDTSALAAAERLLQKLGLKPSCSVSSERERFRRIWRDGDDDVIAECTAQTLILARTDAAEEAFAAFKEEPEPKPKPKQQKRNVKSTTNK